MIDSLHLDYLGACRTAFELTAIPECAGSASVLLLGEDNPISSEPEHALYPLPRGCSGNLLQERILGCSRAVYLAMWRTNLCVGGWKVTAARARARELLLTAGVPWRTVVLLGKKVSAAAEYVLRDAGFPTSLDPLTTCQRLGMTLVSVPHPSGLNRTWNIPGMRESARKLVRDACPGVAWESA